MKYYDESKKVAVNVIPKEKLAEGHWYHGYCRNAIGDLAVWFNGKFVYIREKFGAFFPEEINHPEDDDGFDLFLPFTDVTNKHLPYLRSEEYKNGLKAELMEEAIKKSRGEEDE